MKKILFKLFLVALVSVTFQQCDENDDLFVVSPSLQPVLLDADVPGTLTLDPQFSDRNIINFSWQEADYEIPVQVTYTLEFDDEEAFSEPIAVAITTQRSSGLTVSQLNNAVGDAGLAPFQNGTIYARVVSRIGTQGELPQISNAISFTVYPYTTELPRLYVVGAYQASSGYGSNPEDAPTLASSEFGNETNYEGFVYLDGSNLEFRFHRSGFVGEYVSGNPEYGNDAGLVTEGAAGSFTVPIAGYYLIRANLDTGVISFTETNWAVTGSATPNGWVDADDPTIRPDADMTYDPMAQVWTIALNLTAEELKFRANDSWALNMGDDGADGILDLGNADNIQVPSGGQSIITLDLSRAREYTYSISN